MYTIRGGLSGKARVLRKKDRVERIYQQQLLDEYYGFEEEDHHRPIRLGTRAEFLPSADAWSDEESETSVQADFKLHPQATDGPEETSVHEMTLVAGPDEIDGSMPVVPESKQAPAPYVPVIPAPYWARPKTAFQPAAGRPNLKFDPRGFAVGCVLGSAAAAVILLMISAVF